MRVSWRNLSAAADGARVTLAGFAVPMGPFARADHFLLVEEPTCCPGCAPRDPRASIEVQAAAPVPMSGRSLALQGVWQVEDGDGGSRYRLRSARHTEPPGWQGVSRRTVLAGGPLMCLAACAAPPASPGAKAVLDMGTTVDSHSPAGGIASRSRVLGGAPCSAVAAPMRAGGMAVACLAMVSDGPTHQLTSDGRIRPFRDPNPGELYDYGQAAFRRLNGMARDQGLTVIKTAAAMRSARADAPSVVIAAEGADFLEGRIERVNEAFETWGLRHLQLTHYRVNELGDIQTEPPVHGGLTDFGAEVIRRCNGLGIVVDVAHGTYDLVKRAASVTTKPLVLSHTSLAARPGQFSRQITAEHARVIASTGGVVCVWPPLGIYSSLGAMAAGMARMVDAIGVDHVGIGTDMAGLPNGSVFPDYEKLPALTDALLGVGFGPADVAKLLGGNYIRVFVASVG